MIASHQKVLLFSDGANKDGFSDFNCSDSSYVATFFKIWVHHPQATSAGKLSRIARRFFAQIWFTIAKIVRLGINKKLELIKNSPGFEGMYCMKNQRDLQKITAHQ